MALVHSFSAPNKDEYEENVHYYEQNILVAKEMKRLMKGRFHLAKASVSKHNILSLPQGNLTQLERDLMEVLRILLKLSMNRQILNTALEKSIQSVMLHTVSRNLFIIKRPNCIEYSVGQEMKSMIEKNKLIRLWKEEIFQQYVNIIQLEDHLLGRRINQQERLSKLNRITSQEKKDKTQRIQKDINCINKLGSLLTFMVMQILEEERNTIESKEKLLKITVKWRTPRSFKYY